MAKGIASGMPLSGVMAKRSLLAKFAPGTHGGTYGGNAVACAAALATLDVFAEEDLVGNSQVQGARLLAGLRRVSAGHAGVADVRGRGLMIAIEFADAGTLKPRPDLAKAFLTGTLDRHLILLSCGTYGQAVRFIAPLVTISDEVDQAIEIAGEVLSGL